MGSLCDWLARMCKPEDGSYSDARLKSVAKEVLANKKKPDDDYMKTYYQHELDRMIPEEIRRLRKQLSTALQERKTCTEHDWREQVGKLLAAQTAAVQQRVSGVSNDSELARLVQRNLDEEYRRLRFLSFSNIDLPADVVAEIMAKYEGYGDAP
jgi:hypothetical protein